MKDLKEEDPRWTVPCPQCGKKYASLHGVNIHITKAHTKKRLPVNE